MLPLYIDDEDIVIKDLEKDQLGQIAEWFGSAGNENYKVAMGTDGPMTYDELYEKYLEVLVNVHEFFLGIYKDGEFCGFLKGRVDYHDEGEIWIMALFIDSRYQRKRVGMRTVQLVTNEFKQKLGITKFYACIVKDNVSGKKFWEEADFTDYRLSKGYFKFNNESHDLIIMSRQL